MARVRTPFVPAAQTDHIREFVHQPILAARPEILRALLPVLPKPLRQFECLLIAIRGSKIGSSIKEIVEEQSVSAVQSEARLEDPPRRESPNLRVAIRLPCF